MSCGERLRSGRLGRRSPITSSVISRRESGEKSSGRRKISFSPPSCMWQFEFGGCRPRTGSLSRRLSRVAPAILRQATPQCQGRSPSRCTRTGIDCISKSPLRSVSPQAEERDAPNGQARVCLRSSRAWCCRVSPLDDWRACFMLRPPGGPFGLPNTEPASRGEWMPGSSPRPAPHAAPLGHSLSGR
jgi:hypothetical protein